MSYQSAPLAGTVNDWLQTQHGVSLADLLAPIDSAAPAGRNLRGGSQLAAIEQARREDDASLPLGSWEYELKRADWHKVARLCTQHLATQSKDLQLAAWLLEAGIHQTGFAALASCFALLQGLCERYWDSVYPLAEEGDLEYRANIFRWANDKLLPALRLVPLSQTDQAQEMTWADWELARKNEQRNEAASANAKARAQEGGGSAELGGYLSATPLSHFLALQGQLQAALQALATLCECLDQRFASDAPSMASMEGILQQILRLLETELHKRGVRKTAQASVAEAGASTSAAATPATGVEAVDPTGNAAVSTAIPLADLPLQHAQVVLAGGAIRDRAEAYARLAETAEFLMRIEPHSPVPYLVRRATEWGGLNTVELYEELFLKLGGQLNIFEMLGLERQVSAQ